MTELLPLFLNLSGRTVVLVGGGPVAAAKLRQLVAANATVRVVAPAIVDDIRRAAAAHGAVTIVLREFASADLDDAWLVVAAAAPDVNRAVADAANTRRLFVNAVDDPANASAFLSGVVRRSGVTLAISTSGDAPALTSLLREGIDAVLPADLERWMQTARDERAGWRRDAVAMDARKPKLLRALNALYDAKTDVGQGQRGKAARAGVSLVGAGPGDPGLLTRTAIARLRAADLVLYDALIDARILKYARKAQKFFVGKRANRHAMTQQAIHALMIRSARRGRRVVRLKGGDPFVFGRGGEEAIALENAGIPYEVVPGVTSAVAAPAAAGIPVTHRGVASAFLVVSGHDAAAFAAAVGGLAPGGVTLVILMGIGRSRAIASTLVARGWTRATPAAVVVGATTGDQQVWRGTLDDLASDRVEIAGGAAGTIVVGEVVALGLGAELAPPVEGHKHVSRG